MPPARGPRRVFLVAGEVSGDLHGAELAREIAALDPGVLLEGVGGFRMAAAGVRLVEESGEWGIMGWVEAARHARPFLRRLARLTSYLLADPPDLLVPIDFSGFNLALLGRVRGRIRSVYYVPPMVSVRRGNRARRVASLGARLLAIFPFEAEAYRRAGADVAFVGHPAAGLREVVEPGESVRARLGIPRGAEVVGLFPGSRKQELDSLLGPMLDAARIIEAERPGTVFLLAVASPAFRQRIDTAVRSSGVRVVSVEHSLDVFAASTSVLIASGTAAVEAMVVGVPMVVAYRASPLNWWMAHVALKTRFASVPNMLAGEAFVPELLQGRATPASMGREILALMESPSAREAIRARLLRLSEELGPPGAARRAAAEVLAALDAPALKPDAAIK